MSTIHYFQRYSSAENTVTNNTLQLFARIYEYSPDRLSALLNEITGEDLDTGIEIGQQERSGDSVPDGFIAQRSFKIIIETKVDAAVRNVQLVNHSYQFGEEALKILLLLTKEGIDASQEREIMRRLHENNPEVRFKSVTFEMLCRASGELFQEHETAINAIVQDYEHYCNDTGLFDQSKHLMRIVPCSVSIDLNAKYGIYYHPSDRGYTRHAYQGIYSDKSVRYIWKIESVFDVDWDGTLLRKTLIDGNDTDAYDEKLGRIIEESKTHCNYDVENGHRFFCGQPFETDFKKLSNGGIHGARFKNLKEILGDFESAEDAASRLKGLTWT